MESFNEISPFQMERLGYQPSFPSILEEIAILKAVSSSEASNYSHEMESLFPHLSQLSRISFERTTASSFKPLRVGVVFSGGQAPGGNNVISGLFDALPNSVLIGILGGPSGLIKKRSQEITADLMARYRNQGGFDLLGSDRTKLEPEVHAEVLKNVQALNLDGLVIVGGDDSNTNAALLSEYFSAHNVKTKVIGIPKTIDGDLKGPHIEASFGFDTATKVYSDTIGNLARDALSAGKYYFFVKLMGRTASHIALECALQTHPNCTLIGEELQAQGKTLSDVVALLADLICERSKLSKDHGIILIPEGLLEFIPECQKLIQELTALTQTSSMEETAKHLSPASRECFESLPENICRQLLLDRDPHGNLQVSKIETERLLIELIEVELQKRKAAGSYQGKFNPQPLFLGYEGRSCAPSNFDANYCYALGRVAAALIHNGLTGYMAGIKGLALPITDWQPVGVPLVSMVGFEQRKGKRKAVISKALVDVEGYPFAAFKQNRVSWFLNDDYRYPGAIQYFGPHEITGRVTLTLALEQAALTSSNR